MTRGLPFPPPLEPDEPDLTSDSTRRKVEPQRPTDERRTMSTTIRIDINDAYIEQRGNGDFAAAATIAALNDHLPNGGPKRWSDEAKVTSTIETRDEVTVTITERHGPTSNDTVTYRIGKTDARLTLSPDGPPTAYDPDEPYDTATQNIKRDRTAATSRAARIEMTWHPDADEELIRRHLENLAKGMLTTYFTAGILTADVTIDEVA